MVLLWIDLIYLVVALSGAVLNGLVLWECLIRRGRGWLDGMLGLIVGGSGAVGSVQLMAGIVVRWVSGAKLKSGGTWCRLSGIGFSGLGVVGLGYVGLLAVLRFYRVVHRNRDSGQAWAVLSVPMYCLLMGLFVVRCFTSRAMPFGDGLHCSPRHWGHDTGSKAFGCIVGGLALAGALAVLVFRYRLVQYRSTRTAAALYSLLILLVLAVALVPRFAYFLLESNKVTRSLVAEGLVNLAYFSLVVINAVLALDINNDLTLGLTKKNQISLNDY
ncbi:hypothetical protein DSO57_1033176 [Entomophthora muscae]|uniref:Uncharacterized protein n=1 Tax=Entomophthora muscae TaxID=34485 RepID=A0ACC2ULV0_9FUNG|nr:hypothetical protein DSO57_1033176 [Entomophthora muscae]